MSIGIRIVRFCFFTDKFDFDFVDNTTVCSQLADRLCAGGHHKKINKKKQAIEDAC